MIVADVRLANTTGRAMAKAQGVPTFPIAVIKSDIATSDMIVSEERIEAMAAELAPQVEAILFGRRLEDVTQPATHFCARK